IAMMNIPYSLMILHNDKYNSLQQRGWSQGKMKAMLHHSTINQLIKKIDNAPYEGIVIDQFCQPSVYINYLKSEQKYLNDKTYFMKKAENHAIANAAGSVIARASFLQEMKRLSHEIGIDLLKWDSTKVDQLIARIIKEKYLNDKTYFMTKAENHAIAVAARSVIARASFLQEMNHLSHEIEIDLLKGAYTKVDQHIARIIKEKGHSTLERKAKLHFKNTE